MNESRYYIPVYQISLAEQRLPQKNIILSCFSILREEHINAFSTQHIVCVPTCTESIFVFTDMCWTVWKHYMKTILCQEDNFLSQAGIAINAINFWLRDYYIILNLSR